MLAHFRLNIVYNSIRVTLRLLACLQVESGTVKIFGYLTHLLMRAFCLSSPVCF